MRTIAIMFLLLLSAGCSTIKNSEEFEAQKSIKAALDDQFTGRMMQSLKTDGARAVIKDQALKTLDEQIPPDERATLHLVMKYSGESLAALALAVSVYLRKRLTDEKKKNGGKPAHVA